MTGVQERRARTGLRTRIRAAVPCPKEDEGCGVGVGEHCVTLVHGNLKTNVHAARWRQWFAYLEREGK